MRGTDNAWRRLRVVVPAGLLAGLGGLAGISGCNSDNNFVVPVVTKVVSVFRDTSFDFATLHTFAIPDTVVHFEPLTGTPIAITRQFDQTALDRVRADLIARGYTEVSNPRIVKPDFIVLVGATATASYNAFIGYSWFTIWGFSPVWGWFTPGFTTNWGIVYPWFGVVGATSFARGTLVVDLIPTSSVNPTARTIRSAWTGVAASLLDGTIDDNTIDAAIDEMFRLSPYLTATSVAVAPR
jgi:Domain of unknown function (DUF4136)